MRASFCLAVGGYADPLGRRHALAEQWNGSRWRIVPGPHGTGLSDVSCTSATFCMALGSPAQSWDGRRWTSARTPHGLALAGISCTRRSFCMAVGSGTRDGFACEGAAAWNGTRWRAFPILDPCRVASNGFTRVSCVSASRCVAVGINLDPDSKAFGTLAEQWNGKKWQLLATPVAGPESALSDVSCPTRSFCMAVGFADIEITAPCTGTCNLVLTWNGRSWQQVDAPGAGGLSAVSCVSATTCLAVSGSQAMSWNGSAWTQLTLAQPGTAGMSLPGIACQSGTACMAAGAYTTLDGASLPLAEQWNGSTWKARRTPGGRHTLTATWNGTAWTVQPSLELGGTITEFTGVWCTGASNCIAVGDHNIGGASPLVPLAARWNGTAWAVLKTPIPGGAGGLTSVRCSRPATCMAVGSHFRRSGHAFATTTLAESWNGSRWQVRATPAIRGQIRQLLTSVSCSRPARCMAVGGYFSPSGKAFALAEAWNGTAWRRLTSIRSPDPAFNYLYGVACPAAARCVAVGEQGVQRTSGYWWNGARWRQLRTGNP